MFAGGLLATSSLALAEISANVALTSDYVWRGVSQAKEDPAIQGGFDFSHGSGLYLGVWGSNVDFGSDEHVEIDLYGGVSGELGNGLGWDVGVIHYDYPSVSASDFDEVYVGASYKMLSAKYSHSVGSPDTGDYLEVGLDFELPQGFGLGLHAGHYDKPSGGDDYSDYKVSLSKEVQGFTFDLSYTDTSGWDAVNKISSGANANDSRFFLTVSKSF